MKIVSNFKDYYDYISGMYGEDPKLRFERVGSKKGTYSKHMSYIFWICDDPILAYLNDKDEWVYDRWQHLKFCREHKTYVLHRKLTSEEKELKYDISRFYNLGFNSEIKGESKYQKMKLNTKHSNPVLISYLNGRIYDKCPKLSDTFIPKIFSAQDIYLKISNFLSYKEPPINSNPDDMNRYEAKGFDKKTNFRHRK